MRLVSDVERNYVVGGGDIPRDVDGSPYVDPFNPNGGPDFFDGMSEGMSGVFNQLMDILSYFDMADKLVGVLNNVTDSITEIKKAEIASQTGGGTITYSFTNEKGDTLLTIDCQVGSAPVFTTVPLSGTCEPIH